MKTTKVKAIANLIKENGGTATWEEIYSNINRYYKGAKESKYWQEGLRGVVYREIRNGHTFKMVGKGVVELKD